MSVDIDEMRHKVRSLTEEINRASHQARPFETLLLRVSSLIRRLTGNENVDAAITKIQRLIMTLRTAQAAIIAFHAASGPVGWALALVGLTAAAVSASDFVLSMGE